jgi:hypothetical protein
VRADKIERQRLRGAIGEGLVDPAAARRGRGKSPIWNRTFGDEFYPEIAGVLENSFQELMITAMLHKTDDADWTEDELSPVRDFQIMDLMPSGSVLGARLTISDGTACTVDFGEIDGYKSC